MTKRNAEELAGLAADYCADAVRLIRVALQTDNLQTEIEFAENSIKSAMRFIEDAKRTLHVE